MAIIREEISNSKLEQLLPPIAVNADLEEIQALDVTGFNSASIIVTVGAAEAELSEDNHLQVRLTHGDDNEEFTDCLDSEVLGSIKDLPATGTFAQVKEAPTRETAFMAGYIGNKRYVRPVIKATGDLGDGVIIGISAMLYGTKYRPVE